MEFPFGHHHHTHHHRPESNEEKPDPTPYPPPSHNPHGYQQPPPPQQYYGGPPPVHHDYSGGYFPPPPVQHVAHEVGAGGYGHENRVEEHHHHRPGFFPSSASHVEHVSHEGLPSNQRTVRVFTKAEENYSLTIRDGEVVLAPANPRDEYQHWIKDLKYSTRVKDEESLPSFSLVNKVTGQAIKHSVGASHPVRLVPYNPDYLDESVLWTESKDTGEDFRCIRMVNNIRLNFDAFHGDEDHGGVRDGTKVVLWEWLKGKNQRWKIVPY